MNFRKREKSVPICFNMLYAEVNLETLRDNLRRLRSLRNDTDVLLVVKGDAYGHGLEAVAEAAADLVDWFGVGTLAEARTIRTLGIGKPVLVGATLSTRDLPAAIREGFHLVAGDWGYLREAERAAAAARAPAFVHILVDGGQGPLGVRPEEVEGLVRELSFLPHVEPVGICSHLPVAHSDRPEEIALTAARIARFRELVLRLERRGLRFPFVHIANSAGFLSFPETSAEPFNLVRIGVAAYGYVDRFWREWGLRPVARVWSEVVALRDRSSPGAERLALLGVGYRHGLSDRLRWAWVNGARAPVWGRIGMDELALDVSGIPGVKRGTEVLLFDGTGENFRGWMLPTLVPMLAHAERSWTKAPAPGRGAVLTG